MNKFYVIMESTEIIASSSEENQTKEKQLARSILRERFLRAITSLIGTDCQLNMYSNTSVKGVFKGCDIEFENLLVEKLKTPFAEISHGKIRSSDVHFLEFKNVKLPP